MSTDILSNNNFTKNETAETRRSGNILSNTFRKIFGSWTDWTLYEKLWFAIFTATNISLLFLIENSLIGVIASISGMLCVLLVAKGKISNFFFGIIQAITYGYVAYTYGLFGESTLNWFFFLPLQFLGIYLWSKNRVTDKESETGEDVVIKTLNMKQWLIMSTVIVVAIALYAMFLSNIGGSSVGLDSATNVLSIAAQILMLRRFAEQWLMWILINILSITMWAISLASQDGGDISMLVMWSAFLLNSVYGYINWRKISKAQKENPAIVKEA